ncbi:thiamine-phosphate diphosphorylase [Luteibacter rhizovicinus]|uniref:Thiamine-phosphate synthase n=1 Tax=Luteibacter rhizovicinus TaxID=242606 RepID=A0A4R3YHS4_9GAMM|nr:thiamine phosphate synthase [Luteibacter rhizovicinus]TCV92175.1 thiamine-phosphate diphosphorylase [Luteibacter rhizovicinus]
MNLTTKHRLAGKGVYAVTDGPRDDLFAAVEAALAGGARILQYRDKTTDASRRLAEASELSSICARYDAIFIVNDDVALAARVGAGVHLGAEDGDIAAARATLGPDAIVGVSCYDSIQRGRDMAAAGADYIAFGAFFPSPTKPNARRAPLDVLRQAAALGLPLVAIGGITVDNAHLLVDAGANYVAVVSAIFSADDIQTATRRFADIFDTTHGFSA